MPITGEGIYRALLSGDIAAKCIVQNNAKKYPYEVYRSFIKWQVVGMNMIRTGNIVNNIGEKAMLFLWHQFFDRLYKIVD